MTSPRTPVSIYSVWIPYEQIRESDKHLVLAEDVTIPPEMYLVERVMSIIDNESNSSIQQVLVSVAIDPYIANQTFARMSYLGLWALWYEQNINDGIPRPQEHELGDYIYWVSESNIRSNKIYLTSTHWVDMKDRCSILQWRLTIDEKTDQVDRQALICVRADPALVYIMAERLVQFPLWACWEQIQQGLTS